MEKIQAFLTSKTPITDSISVPNWLFVVLAVVLVLLVIIIISATKNSKKSNVKEKSPIGSNPEVIPFLEDEKPEILNVSDDKEITFIQDVAVVSEKSQEIPAEIPIIEEPAVIKTVAEAEESAAEEAPAPIEEESPAPVEEEVAAPVEEATVVETPIVEETVAEEVKPSEIAPLPETEVLATQEAEIVTQEAEEQPPVCGERKVEGKFEICNSDLGGYRYILRANNGQLLYESRDYKNVDSCADAINKFINAVKNGDFSVKADKFDRFKFILKSPTSNNSIFTGESFSTNSACLSNIESVKRFAEISPVYDMTQADFVAASKPFEINEEVKAWVSNFCGATGKWVIENEENNGKTVYIYLLYANNGQLLYESRDYASYASCKSGLETFIKTVKDGEFIIDPDKAGRYKFILRSKNKNSMVEYLGQNYSTQKAAESSAESVYKFALQSPIDHL